MIAIGLDGDSVVFFGSHEGALVTFRGTREEAQGALRQLQAMLGAAPVPTSSPGEGFVVRGAPAWVPPGLPDQPPMNVNRIPASPLILPGTPDFGDAVREAAERDAREVAARDNVGRTVQVAARRTSEEELAKQNARRQRLLGAGDGDVDVG